MKRRIFVGVPLSDEARRGVGKLVKQLEKKRWPVKWEAAKKWHVTVAFLGWMEEGRLSEVVEAVKAGAKNLGELELRFKGLGAFPDLVAPRVVWLGLKGDVPGLAKLSQAVQAELKLRDLPVEERAFVPHVTVGRMGKEVGINLRNEMGKQIKKLVQMDLPYEWRADKIVVYESQMRRNGSVYFGLATVSLGRGHVLESPGDA